jgi:galactokinase
MKALRDRVQDEYARRFGPPGFLVRAPGRVNLIGEHTDYNGGFVLPMAIDRATWIAGRARDDRVVTLHSLDYGETASFSLDSLVPGTAGGWIAYAKGVAGALMEQDATLRGWDGVVAGDVPIGAGLASSASFALASARAYTAAASMPWRATEMARVCLRAENHWIGLNCGIMDQLISACGRAGHALLIDCRDSSFQAIPLPINVRVVVLDTGKPRSLTSSAYNVREAQCTAAAHACGVRELRDADLAQVMSAGLDEVTLRRARHVVTENARTLAAAEAMRSGNVTSLGELMNASHESLREDFEVSCEELDIMVAIARRQSSCLGARMTGAGFGGCAVALVEAHDVGFEQRVGPEYQRSTHVVPNLFGCVPSEGATEEPVEVHASTIR